jgi:nicotinate-nucleotide adenylyltransferase
MRLALFGGSFDPPHRGHVAIARAAADRFALNFIAFAPAGRQPLKSHGSGASFKDRMRMVELASREDRHFITSDLDAPHADGSPNYTVDALARLGRAIPDAKLFNLVGADSFHSLAQWREPERLLDLAEWIVVSRPGYELAEPPGITLSVAQRARIHLLDSIHEDVAATDLRERLRHGDRCEDLLPAAVADYIQQHHLYLGS